jgi:hypothetical protein
LVEPGWLLNATHGETTSRKRDTLVLHRGLDQGTSWPLSPEKPRATKLAPSTSASCTRSIGSSLLTRRASPSIPLSAVAENWPLVRP